MSPNAPAVTLDELLAHRRWVRALAHSLVADPHGADDIEQQVWLAAIEKPPKQAGNLRAWLARIVRRRRIDQLRREHRRDAHEAHAPTRVPVPSPDVVVSQAETQTRVAHAVLELDEPYRSTILLRYVQERSAREIAALQGVPVETVRTRVGRGLGMLRGRLERDLGPGPTGWLGALLPVAGFETTPKVASGIGTAALTPKAIPMGAVLVLLVLSAALLIPPVLDRGEEQPTAGHASLRSNGGKAMAGSEAPSLRGMPNAARARHAEHSSVAESVGNRSLARGAGLAAQTPSDARLDDMRYGVAVEPGEVAGTVRDTEGRPLALAEIELAVPPGSRVVARTATDAHGKFSIVGLEEGEYLLVVRFGSRVMRPVSVRPGRQALEIALQRSSTISGCVVDEGSGDALPNVLVTAVQGTGGAGARRTGVCTDNEGRFVLRDLDTGLWSLVARSPGSLPESRAKAFVDTRVGPVEAGTRNLRIVLRRGLVIDGVIQGPDGEPWTAGARVRILPVDATGRADYAGRHYLEAAADGTFRTMGLPRGYFDLTVEPNAGEDGTTPSSLAYVPGVAAGTTGLVVNLVVGRRLTGRLVDEQGQPVTAQGLVQVSPTGRPLGGSGSLRATLLGGGRFTTTPLDPGAAWDVRARGFAGYGVVHLHGVAIDRDELVIVLPRGLQITGRVVDPQGRPAPADVPVVVKLTGHGSVAGPLQSWEYAYVTTDAVGAFRVTGLRELAYTVSAGGSTSGYFGVRRHQVAAPVDDLVLTVERGVPLTGRVVDAHGEGIAFVTLYARCARIHGTPPLTTTRRDGRFAFAGVPQGRLRITANLEGQSLELGVVETPTTDVTLTAPE